MHLFYDSTLNTWRLITEKLPEKPNFGGKSVLSKDENTLRLKYLETIAALKQNALTVGNQELANSVFIGEPLSDKLYFWPGGYKTKEIPPPPIQYVNGVAIGSLSKTVAILTLPEEKKNTMENALEVLKINANVPKPQIPGVLEAMKEYSIIETNKALDEAIAIVQDVPGMFIRYEDWHDMLENLKSLKR